MNNYHGLQIYHSPYGINARIKTIEGIGEDAREILEETRLNVIARIPFENNIAYDIDGDEYYPCPHHFCDFSSGADPFEEICYITDDRRKIRESDIIEKL